MFKNISGKSVCQHTAHGRKPFFGHTSALHVCGDESGNTLVELVMVMVLMIFFGFTIFTLIQAGSHTEQKIIANKNAQVDARIAMSYVNVRIRKNDASGQVEVKTVDHTGQSGIVLRYRSFEGDFDRWIYYNNGTLYECMTDPDVQPTDDLAFPIVDLEGFSVSYDEVNNTIVTSLEYEYNGESEEIETKYRLRNTKTDTGSGTDEMVIIM
jgi:type II secretory pathway pseudopilin PulG